MAIQMYWEMEKGKIVLVQYLESLRVCGKTEIICLHGKAILRAKIALYLALFYPEHGFLAYPSPSAKC